MENIKFDSDVVKPTEHTLYMSHPIKLCGDSVVITIDYDWIFQEIMERKGFCSPETFEVLCQLQEEQEERNGKME